MAGCSWLVGNATSIPTDVWNFQLKVDLIVIHDDGGGFFNLVTKINYRCEAPSEALLLVLGFRVDPEKENTTKMRYEYNNLFKILFQTVRLSDCKT